jgi:hypothetical protein
MICKSVILVSILVGSARVASAQGVPAPPPPPPGGGGAPGTEVEGPKLWGGVAAEIIPSGNLKATSGGMSNDFSLATAYAVTGLIDYRVSPLLSVGFSPRYVASIKPSNDTSGQTASAVDLRARLTARTQVAPQIMAFGYGAIGYTTVLLPSQGTGTQPPNPTGFSLTFAAGAAYEINPRMMLTGELGYTLGFEGVSFMGTDVTYNVNLLHLGVGLTFALGQ